MEYKIGQILTSKEDVEVEKALSGDKIVVPKGNKIIIGADNFAHHIRNGMIQPLPDDTKVKGYDAAGIAEYLYKYLSCRFPIDEMLEELCDGTEKEFVEQIEYALDDIGI